MQQQTKFILPLMCLLGGMTAFILFSHSPDAGSQTGGTHTDTQAHLPNIQSFGDHHIEAQMDKAGGIQLFFYGTQPGQLLPIPIEEIKQTLHAETLTPGEDPAVIALHADPLPGEAAGMTSRFAGKFDRRSDQQQVGIILTFTLNGSAYRVRWQPGDLAPGQFNSAAHKQTDMPAAVSSTEAQKLFLTPGGIYTQADIEANGKTTAAEKYRGLMAKHNLKPVSGAPICPITLTAADSRFVWTVGGRKYLFCCPPCIEEFVRLAKEKPKTILLPAKYVQP